MYDTNITYCPPDRLLTEMYKDNRDSEKRKFDRLNELLDFPTVQQIKMKLYKGQGENFICHGEFVNRTDIEWFLKYKQTNIENYNDRYKNIRKIISITI